MGSFLATRAVTPAVLSTTALTPTTTNAANAGAPVSDRFSDGAISVAGTFANFCGPITRRTPAIALALSATACTNGEIAAGSLGALVGFGASLFIFSPLLSQLFGRTSRLIARTDVDALVNLRRISEIPWRAYAFGPKQIELMINTINRTDDATRELGLVTVLDNLAQTRPGIFTRMHVGGMRTVHQDKPELRINKVIARFEGLILK